MKRNLVGLFALVVLPLALPVAAQDATILNARVVIANGVVFESGAIVVRGGKIVEVTPGAPAQRVGTVIDARGMTAVPGFLDAHKHINTGPLEKQQMAELIEAGFTTVLSGGGPGDGNIVLRDKIEPLLKLLNG